MKFSNRSNVKFYISLGMGALLGAAVPTFASAPSVIFRTVAPFDLLVQTGQTLIIDTSSAMLTDTHGQTIQFLNGNIFLNSLTVQSGGKILGQGPNALRFFVTGDVNIQGVVSVDGSDAPDVAMLLTAGAFIQKGAKGQCGGGDGGDGNPTTAQSSVKGGDGLGAAALPIAGGRGGESSLLPFTSGGTLCQEVEDMHPAGGGGGSFTTIGERGNNGCDVTYSVGGCSVPKGVSAVNPSVAPQGGDPGAATFVNSDLLDDFLGVATGDVTKITALSFSPALMSVITTNSPIFGAADVGRFVGLYISSGSWEDAAPGCNSLINQADLIQCPRSHYLLRKITGVNANNQIEVFPALPVAVPAADKFVVKYTYGGSPMLGELSTRVGGQGGGGGGNQVHNTTFPNPNYTFQDRSGAGGGGGGGIVEIYAGGIINLTNGQITANGGDGAGGENTIGTDRAAGGSGGGSGGMIRIQSANSINATGSKILARGGGRGVGAFSAFKDPTPTTSPQGIGHGGRGGKGIVQLHAPDDGLGNAKITVVTTQLTPVNFDPSPIIGTPEFSDDPARQRQLWF